MSSFHIQILPYQFYQHSLYKDKINIINSLRMTSVFNVLENLKISNDYYKDYINIDKNITFIGNGYLINSNIF
jgi:hypothetical protein